MRFWAAIAICAIGACTDSPNATPTNTTPAAPALIDIPTVPPQPGLLSDVAAERTIDLDALVERGYLRVLVAPSRTHFETADSGVQGRTVDAAVAMAEALSKRMGKRVAVEFVGTREDTLVPDLLAGRGDLAANVLLTFARDEQVAFAPPIRSGIRELVVTGTAAPLVSLEDVGGKTIHVRKNSEHHASLLRLNRQLKAISRPPARVVVEEFAKTDEELLEKVNRGTIPATIVDDYIFDRWKQEFPKITANRDVAVSQDGVRAWVTRKDTPKLTAFVKEFFSTHKLTF
jgi:membrane-bound lytic murein transglycosylase MltF